jgi:hypothetical protein
METKEQRIERLQQEVKTNLKDLIDQMTIDSYDLGEMDFSDKNNIVLTIRGRMEN